MKSKTMALIRKYENGPGDLIAAVDGLNESQLDRRLSPGKWSIRQQINHLADSELNMVHRMKKVLSEDSPLLMAFDQDKWAKRSSYENLSAENSVALFYTLRAAMVPILKSLQEKDFERFGIHSENGKVSMKDLLEDAIEHSEHHTKQIESIKRKHKIR